MVTHPSCHFDPCCLLSINLTPLVNHLLCGFWALKKRKKKRFALGLGINNQLSNMLCGIFMKSTSWLAFLSSNVVICSWATTIWFHFIHYWTPKHQRWCWTIVGSMLSNQHIGTFVGPTFEGLWINQKEGKIHDAMQWYLHCKFYLLFRGIITLQRKRQISVAIHGISWKL